MSARAKPSGRGGAASGEKWPHGAPAPPSEQQRQRLALALPSHSRSSARADCTSDNRARRRLELESRPANKYLGDAAGAAAELRKLRTEQKPQPAAPAGRPPVSLLLYQIFTTTIF